MRLLFECHRRPFQSQWDSGRHIEQLEGSTAETLMEMLGVRYRRPTKATDSGRGVDQETEAVEGWSTKSIYTHTLLDALFTLRLIVCDANSRNPAGEKTEETATQIPTEDAVRSGGVRSLERGNGKGTEIEIGIGTETETETETEIEIETETGTRTGTRTETETETESVVVIEIGIDIETVVKIASVEDTRMISIKRRVNIATGSGEVEVIANIFKGCNV